MRASYLSAADSEFDEAIAYYNTQRAGLGFEFANEVKEAVERIKNYPEPGHRYRIGCGAARSIVFRTALSTKSATIS